MVMRECIPYRNRQRIVLKLADFVICKTEDIIYYGYKNYQRSDAQKNDSERR